MSSSTKVKSQTYSNGLYGSSTTNSSGTTYNPTDFEKQLVQMTSSAVPQYLNQLINPTYDSEVFKAQTEQRNKLASTSFENNLINPLASRGLTRGSSVNQLSGQFANKLADLETEAMANEDTRNSTMLNNLLQYYQVPASTMQTATSQSSNLYNQATQNSSSNSLLKTALMGTGAAIGGYFGGAAGANVGAKIGEGVK